MTRRRERIIDQLRRHIGGTWRYDQREYYWEQVETGRRVRGYAQTICAVDGPRDDLFDSHLRWEDTGERLSFGSRIAHAR